MIRRTRSSAPVRAALCVAVLLSLTASFGLHPEPSGPRAPSGTASFAARASLAAPAHDCVACLNGGSAIAAAPAGLSPAAAESSPAALGLEASAPSRLACRSLSGRSPPAAPSS